MKRVKLLIVVAVLLCLIYGVWVGTQWTVMRVYVPEDQALVVVNKFGADLPQGMVVVPANDNHFKGVQEEVRGPGRYFIDPVEYSTQLVDLVVIPAGNPEKWTWDAKGQLSCDKADIPMVGLVTMKSGKTPSAGVEVVDAGFQGIQKQVLTPGTYKINPYVEEVTLVPAVVIPPGSVGVVTRLVEDNPGIAVAPTTAPTGTMSDHLVTGNSERGILRDVLQPGIYYLNPRMVQVTVMPIGYDEISLDHTANTAVHFYSQDGYQIQADFTVVWGRTAGDAPDLVATIGTSERIEENLITPAMKAACQNEGSKYTAVQLIQGQTRSQFQDDLSSALSAQVTPRHVQILLALVRDIAISDNSGKDATTGLLATIQRANIEVERQITNLQKTTTAAKQAELEQALKLVDVARENVAADTKLKVANILADGQKKAAEIDADRDLQTATIQLQVAELDSQRTSILGKANADVTQMKNEAEAQGAKLMVDAFGSPQAYNLYTFAKNFQPTDMRLIFAGPGTMWTDLKSLQDTGAAKIIQQAAPGASADQNK